MSQMIIPGGQEKGKTVAEASDKTLAWWAENANRDDLKTACAAEIKRRSNGGTQAKSAASTSGGHSTALAPSSAQPPTRRSAGELVTGSFRTPTETTEALRVASERAHLISPATVCGAIPEGCEVILAAVMIDKEKETYKLPGGKLGLDKVALDRIAAAAGVDWDPELSRRMDDGSHPHYCHWRAVGYVRDLDGRERTLPGNCEMDMREGSPQLDEIVFNAENEGKDPRSQIIQLRKFLMRHAESKAMNRAVRKLGVRTAYKPEELNKPFIVAKLMFTGQSNDPEARQYYRERIADSFMGARQSLYGGRSEPALPPSRPVAAHLPDRGHHSCGAHHPPPPVGTPIDAEFEEHSPSDASSDSPQTKSNTSETPTDPKLEQPGQTAGDPRPAEGSEQLALGEQKKY